MKGCGIAACRIWAYATLHFFTVRTALRTGEAQNPYGIPMRVFCIGIVRMFPPEPSLVLNVLTIIRANRYHHSRYSMRYVVLAATFLALASMVPAQSRTFRNVSIEHILSGVVDIGTAEMTSDSGEVAEWVIRTNTVDVYWRMWDDQLMSIGVRVRYGMDRALHTRFPDPVYTLVANLYGFRNGIMPYSVVEQWNGHLAWLIRHQRAGTVGIGGHPMITVHMGPETYYMSIH